MKLTTNLTFDQLIKEAITQIQKGSPALIEFDGNCDDCSGWNGIDDRCYCGNRRVYWALSDDETYVYPCAD